ncbi:patched domain-containing protein 3-like [Centruroides sculpturatus]|uniref:patched domain-containing protein 3-like n=1 Tax=Centruroides sculpturatus TaxID=218467 RepID=UPI000C6E8AAB|nr:patched domain-containing protein 3-like [Centruroides sculpturatus]
MNLHCDERKCNVIYLKMSRIFRHLGEYIAQHPLWFTFVPVVVTIVFSAGFFRLELTTDIDYIFFPINGRSLVAKASIERLFPENSTDFDFSRAASPGKYGVVIATTISGDSMLFNSVFDDLHALDRTVLNMSVTLNGRRYTYANICRKYKGKCMQNHILNLQTKIEDLKKGHYKIKFPIDMDPNTSEFVAYAMSLGGVTKDEDDVVKDFKAVRLIYFLDYSDDMKHEIALLWEEKFLDLLSTIKYHHIKVTYFSGRTIEDELNSLTSVNLSLVMLAQIFMILFAVATCMTADCVSSKPWIAIAGCMSSVFGVGTAFGLLVLCGMEYIDLNISVPLFVLGVGIDDSFVLLSAWRKSDPKYAIKERMGETYSEAAISITITTITNVTASIVGITTPYRSIQIICSYMAASFAFAYVYQLTFFGGCLTLSGKREIKGLHSIYCGRVKSNTSIG